MSDEDARCHVCGNPFDVLGCTQRPYECKSRVTSPGPWSVKFDMLADATGRTFGVVYRPADCALAAAAPEMAALLREVFDGRRCLIACGACLRCRGADLLARLPPAPKP